MISFPEFNFVFVGIPKTGSSSMQARLFRLGTADPNSQARHDIVFYPNAQHYTLKEYEQILGEEIESRFKFAFVRNPWDRLVSSYTRECTNWRNRFLFRDDLFNVKKFQNWVPHVLFPNRRAPNRRCSRYPTRLSIPQLSMIMHERIEMDFIGRFENIESDFETVLNRINSIYSLPPRKHWKLPKINISHGATEHYSFYYNDELVDMVHAVYKRDIDYFGYEFERA